MNAVEQRLLNTACQLFYEEGIAHVGVDRLVRDANVAKMSLYHCYGSKDGLVVAFLEESHRRWRNWFTERLEQKQREPGSSIDGFFAVLEEWLGQDARRGCPLINAAVELPDANHPGLAVVKAHRTYLRTLIHQVVAQDGVTPDALLVEQILVLMDGAIIGTLMGQPDAASAARQAAMALLQIRTTTEGEASQ